MLGIAPPPVATVVEEPVINQTDNVGFIKVENQVEHQQQHQAAAPPASTTIEPKVKEEKMEIKTEVKEEPVEQPVKPRKLTKEETKQQERQKELDDLIKDTQAQHYDRNDVFDPRGDSGQGLAFCDFRKNSFSR